MSFTHRSARAMRAEGGSAARSGSRRKQFAAAAAVSAVSVGAIGVWATTAGAATAPIPSFPDNIVVFPDRDFVSVEGYSEYGGATALLEVNRPGIGIVGSALAEVSGTDVAFEINHPGGYCWGHGTGVNVTPDIIAGDEVTLSIDGTALGTTTVLDVYASDAELQPDGVTMLVRGHIGAEVLPDQMEQRIIEPALRDTPIGKRDIRAVLGGFEPGPNGGYQSKLEVDPATETFVATYVFDDQAVAEIAANAGLGERAMAWQLVDADANRQGLTIAEFGEPGGPGMGGCPNGPLQSGPPAPNHIAAVPQSDGTAIKVNWEVPAVIPGTQPILGYRVRAVDNDAINGSEYAEIGRRIDDPTASGTIITGLDPLRSYHIEVESISDVGVTFPAARATVLADSQPPTIAPSPNGGSFPTAQQLTLNANEIGVDMYFTISTDGTPPVDPIDGLGGTDATATAYTGPIDITQSAIVKFAGYDPTGNPSAIETVVFSITGDPTAAKTSILSATAGVGEVQLTWAAADPVSPGTVITKYVVRAYDSATSGGVKATAEFLGAGTAGTVTGLEANVDLWFTVAAVNDVNSVPGAESDRFGPVTPKGALVANAGFDRTNVPRNTTVQLSGAGSTVATDVVYKWVQLTSPLGLEMTDSANPLKVEIINSDQQDASFVLPYYDYRMWDVSLRAPSPLYFQLQVTNTTTHEVRSDSVTIVPRNDSIAIASARWKAGDFRVSGTGGIEGAVITVRTVNATTGVVTTWGSATVVAGAWDLRLRNGAAPTAIPANVYADSREGATVGPTTVTR